jgi:hypothetical protein
MVRDAGFEQWYLPGKQWLAGKSLTTFGGCDAGCYSQLGTVSVLEIAEIC